MDLLLIEYAVYMIKEANVEWWTCPPSDELSPAMHRALNYHGELDSVENMLEHMSEHDYLAQEVPTDGIQQMSDHDYLAQEVPTDGIQQMSKHSLTSHQMSRHDQEFQHRITPTTSFKNRNRTLRKIKKRKVKFPRNMCRSHRKTTSCSHRKLLLVETVLLGIGFVAVYNILQRILLSLCLHLFSVGFKR